jgi:hypothetical protein
MLTRLKYFGYHPYNNPTHSERNVELPLAFWFLKRFEHDLGNIIEVGEVTPFYRQPGHLVYDPGAEFSSTIKTSAGDVDYRGKHLLSISTIEHIGTGDYGQTPNPSLLPETLGKMLASQSYLITFALGYNRQLEELVRNEPYLVLERIAPTKWKQTQNRELGQYKYHTPWYGGNGVCVLTNLPDLYFEFSRRNILQVAARCRAPKWSWKDFVRGVRQEIADEMSARRRD